MNNILKVIASADWHLGNPRIVAESFYQKITKVFYPELEGCHLLILSGDLYDQLLSVNSKAHKFASIIINDLLRISEKTGMQIRLLHGTYTHDRDQLSLFETLAPETARFRVINQIDVEEISDLRFGNNRLDMCLKVAYIPDNLPYKRSEDAVEQLDRVLACRGWTAVDMLVGHGTFEHVIPPESGHRPPCLFRLDQFQQKVPIGPIIMGHIHTPGRSRNVFYCGSFERMSHGEEEKKGFYVFTREAGVENSWHSRFVVNEFATPFISISPKGDDVTAITANFLAQIDERFPNGSGHVRVLHPDPEIRSLLHKVTVQQFPNITYSSRSSGDKDTTTMRVDEIVLDVFEDVKPDVHNLSGLVFQYLDENNLLGNSTKDEIIQKTEALLPVKH